MIENKAVKMYIFMALLKYLLELTRCTCERETNKMFPFINFLIRSDQNSIPLDKQAILMLYLCERQQRKNGLFSTKSFVQYFKSVICSEQQKINI